MYCILKNYLQQTMVHLAYYMLYSQKFLAKVIVLANLWLTI